MDAARQRAGLRRRPFPTTSERPPTAAVPSPVMQHSGIPGAGGEGEARLSLQGIDFHAERGPIQSRSGGSWLSFPCGERGRTVPRIRPGAARPRYYTSPCLSRKDRGRPQPSAEVKDVLLYEKAMTLRSRPAGRGIPTCRPSSTTQAEAFLEQFTKEHPTHPKWGTPTATGADLPRQGARRDLPVQVSRQTPARRPSSRLAPASTSPRPAPSSRRPTTSTKPPGSSSPRTSKRTRSRRSTRPAASRR